MYTFHNMKLRTKLVLIALLPLVGFIYFSVDNAATKRSSAVEMERMETLARFSVTIGNLAHELQKERGMTAGFLISKGTKFSGELQSQRGETDKSIAKLKQMLNGVDVKQLGGDIGKLVNDSMNSLGQLDAKRNASTAQSIDPPQAFGYYTGIIDNLLGIPNKASALCSDPEILQRFTAYSSQLMIKEHAGQERALLTGAFAADRFTPSNFTQFVANFTEQNTHKEAFEMYAQPDQLAFYESKMRGKAVDEVAAIEHAAIEKMSASSLGIDSESWFSLMTEKINLLKEVENKLADDLIAATGEHKKEALALMYLYMAVSITGLLATLLFAFYIIRTLLKQIGGEPVYAAEIMNRIATGDLTASIETRPGDDSSMLFAMKKMSESLAVIISEVRDATGTINNSSGEIAQGNIDLSQRTEEEASSLEETASSMEELASTVHQNADNAKQANQLAANASDIAIKGGHVVHDVVDTMSSISKSSKKIVEIIGVIEGIAFQTNILALNAAVEAARAGEQGRGFAVVAGEVRNLAQRSAAAAKEIKALIDDSVHKVEDGSKQVDQAGVTMDEIVRAVQRVTDIMSEISAASVEQSDGIEQINVAITQMDDVTQQNAALVEQAAAAAESMREQAEALARAVNVFKLAGGQAAVQVVAHAVARVAAKPAVKHAATHGLPRPVKHAPISALHKPEAHAGGGHKLYKGKEIEDADWKEF